VSVSLDLPNNYSFYLDAFSLKEYCPDMTRQITLPAFGYRVCEKAPE